MAEMTFTINSDADDGAGRRSNAVWANLLAGGAYTEMSNQPLLYLNKATTGTYFLGNVYFRFDTSGLPDDAEITAAVLKIYIQDALNKEAVLFAADYYDFGGEPSVAGDYVTSSPADAITTIDPSGFTIGVMESISLTSLTGISKTGFTGLRLAPKDTVAPTVDNYVGIAQYEHASNPPAQLVVTYTTLTLDQVNPDADIATTGWSTAPLFSKINDDSDATVIQATAS